MIKIKIEIMKEYYNIFLNWKYCKRDNIDLSDGDTNLFPVLSIWESDTLKWNWCGVLICMITLVMWYQPEIKIYKIKMMNQKYILKKILDSLPKLDFKETYAENLHRRLEAEKDQELQKLIKDRIYSLQITDEIKSVLVSEKVKEAAEKLGYRLIITRNKNSYLYNGVFWESVDALELKHFLGKAFQRRERTSIQRRM